MKHFLLLIILFFSTFTAFGQNLLKSRKSSFYTYIYQIKDVEARLFLKEKDEIWENNRVFHTLIDSFPKDKSYRKELPLGHYLFVYAQEQQLHSELESVVPWSMEVLNNQTDFAVIVHDTLGKLIENAQVQLNRKSIPFDKKAGRYLLPKSNRKGILSIKFSGLTSYHFVNKNSRNSRFKRIKNFIIYTPPMRYIFAPIRWVYQGGYSIVKTIQYGSPQGYVRSFLSIFSKERYGKGRYKKYAGYLVMNKPRYLPTDTVRLKALILNGKGKPYEKEAELWLENYLDKPKKLATLKPTKPGVFQYELVLVDSLGLKLDENYHLILKTIGKNDELMRGSFKYEDYELKENEYTFKFAQEQSEFYKGEPISLLLQGKDANELNLLDAKVALYVFSSKVNDQIKEKIFIRDTLWAFERALEPLGETKITLPDSIFPKVGIKLTVKAVFLNANNERTEKSLSFDYIADTKEVDWKFEKDSLWISSQHPKWKNKTAWLIGLDKEDEEIFKKKIQLPYREKINPFIYEFEIETDSLSDYFDFESEKVSSELQCYSNRTKDSVRIWVDNPRKLTFWYTIYFKNQVLKRGKSTELDFKARNHSKQSYFIAVQYVWAGKVKEESYQIPWLDRQLKIEVNQPTKIYPGQKVKIDISVKDAYDKPAPAVDLTAYAFTKKFKDGKSPEMPYFRRKIKSRIAYNKFFDDERKYEDAQSQKIGLNYAFWMKKMGLDSLEFYRWSNPESNLYTHSLPAPTGITQFAPFVMGKYINYKIHWMDVDNQPVYFSDANASNVFSFPVDSGYHDITLRTATQLIEIQKVYFRKGQKLIMSLDPDLCKSPQVRITPQKNEWSVAEKAKILKHLGFVKSSLYNNEIGYLSQGKQTFLLNPYNNTLRQQYENFGGRYYYDYNSTSGANLLFPMYQTKAHFHWRNQANDSLKLAFDFDTDYLYEFAPKADSNKIKKGFIYRPYTFPKRMYSWLNRSYNLDEFAYSPALLDSIWKISINQRGIEREKEMYINRYDNPNYTTENHGRLSLEFKYNDTIRSKTFHLILVKKDFSDFIRIYALNVNFFHQLPKGEYALLFLQKNGNYYKIETGEIQVNGTTYLPIKWQKVIPADTFSLRVLKLIQEWTYYPENQLLQIKKNYNETQSYNPPSNFNHLIQGKITDITGLAIPGVSIFVKGSAIGTVTDIEGNYSLFAPSDGMLVVQGVGYSSDEIEIRGNSVINTKLQEDVQMLGEVVVVGYGSVEKKNLSYSIATVSTTNLSGEVLQGRASGIAINSEEFIGQPGSASLIKIRGITSIQGNYELIIIVDGKVFSGKESDLDKSLITDIQVLKDEKYVALYGSRASNGVIIISTDKKMKENATQMAESGLELNTQNSIRRNFSDYAYWKPNLTTDKAGKASFEVTFPDDITNWKTVVLAADYHKRTGKAEGQIKSYKTLVGSLAVPRFLVAGDTVQVLGKVLNYTSDTLSVQTAFLMGDKTLKQRQHQVINAKIDSLQIIADDSDSLALQYQIQVPDGYMDGELRNIPIYPQGVEENKGDFWVLDKDTTFEISRDFAENGFQLYAQADEMQVILKETAWLRDYPHLCNEQTASKLLALLAEKEISAFLKTEFKFDKLIYRMIRRLEEKQRADGTWGWWEGSEPSLWITQHAVKALLKARVSGYAVNLKENALKEYLTWEIEKNELSLMPSLHILQLLADLKADLDFKKQIERWTKKIKTEKFTITERLALMRWQQALQVNFSLDSLWKYEKKTVFGNVYWGEEKAYLFDNSIQASLIAYQILKKAGNQEEKMRKIRNYLFQQRQNGCWRNTYESAAIIEQILPELLQKDKKIEKTELIFNGALEQKVDKFPFEAHISQGNSLKISKKGTFPVYLGLSQTSWNEKPQKIEKDFVVQTYFEKNTNVLQAGKPVTLTTEVTVKNQAEYVMIEIPIPAGCSYEEKRQNHWGIEAHREYEKNKVNIFCPNLKEGTYTFKISLLPRYSGTYTLNPAKAELMYFPVFFGRNEMKKVEIK